MRSMTGAETFCTIRSYLATAATASAGSTPSPRPPKATPGSPAPHKPPGNAHLPAPGPNGDLSSYLGSCVASHIPTYPQKAGWLLMTNY
jgi:hypothetical protein